MKQLPLLVVACAVAGFIYLAMYGYKHQHDQDGVPTKADQHKLSSMLEETRPVRLTKGQMILADLFGDDGKLVDQATKLRERHRARCDLGKE